MDDQGIATMLREVERNEPAIEWSDVRERTPGRLPAPPRRWPTIVVALAVAVLSFVFLLTAIRPFGDDTAAGGPPGAILFDRRDNIASADVTEQESQIWSVRPDGTGARLVFDVPEAYDEAAVWSPDGSRIVFTSITPDGEGGLYAIDADGAGLRQVRSRFACDSVSWFPDGRRLLCAGGPWIAAEGGGAGRVSDRGIWRVDVESGDAEKLFDHGFTYPSISPDGRRVVMICVTGVLNAKPVSELFIGNADGTGIHRLTHAETGHYGTVAWSPDGSRLAASWEAIDGTLASDVYRIDPGDGSRVRLTDWEGWDAGPVWSPDGSRIAFASDRTADPSARERWLNSLGSGPFEQSIFVMNADGSDPRLLVQGEDFASPTSWRL
jgi:Tol biopolymer transport system component